MNAEFSIELSTGKVYDQEYHTAAPINASKEWPSMMSWMIQTFGPVTAKDGIWTPGQRWYANNAKFWFKDKRDLMLFVLKWS